MHLESWQRNLASIWIAQTAAMIGFSFVFPFMPLYVQTLGVKGTEEAAQWAGAIGASAAITQALSQPMWGNLADRWGRKPMLVRSMVGAGVTTALMGFAVAPDQLLVLRFIQGATTGTIAAANALVATFTPRHRLGFALGLMQVALFVGTTVGPLIGGVIADTLGFRASFNASGALLVLAAILVVGTVQENFTPPAPTAPRVSVWAESRSLLAISLFPVLISVIFLIQLGGNIVTPVLSLFIAELSGGDNAATAAGIVLAGTGFVSAVSALAIGRVGDRIGHRVILPVCLLGAAVSYFPQALVQQTWHLLVLRMLLGVFLGGLMPSANALLAGLAPRARRGAVFGLAGTATALANAVGPLSGAGIATHLGMRAVFVGTGVLFAFGFLWVSLGLRRAPAPAARPEARRPEAASLEIVEGASTTETSPSSSRTT